MIIVSGTCAANLSLSLLSIVRNTFSAFRYRLKVSFPTTLFTSLSLPWLKSTGMSLCRLFLKAEHKCLEAV